MFVGTALNLQLQLLVFALIVGALNYKSMGPEDHRTHAVMPVLSEHPQHFTFCSL